MKNDGVLIVDKPSGMSSFDVIRLLGKKFPQTKMGHLGTLDPMATGVLVVFLGRATQLIRYFSALDKEYEVELELGKVSDTYDVTGDVKEVKDSKDVKDMDEILETFIGPQWQIQPPFSAIKFQGKRAYELAREGKVIDLGKRRVDISAIEIIDSSAPRYTMRMVCSSGTYVRSFVHELGAALGNGAVMSGLSRTRVGKFTIAAAKPLEAIAVGDLISPSRLIEDFLDDRGLAASEKMTLLKKFEN